jgi:beta-N-acetylhexosaminidase
MATLGRADDPAALTRRFAAALAGELQAVGITMDFAPVLDVQTNPANPVIGDRALSQRAERVAELGGIIVETLQEAGIAACGKHFPGHGDTAADSHHELPVVEHALDRLREIEFVPFRAAVAARVAAIMTAHVLVPALDDRQPATLSPRIVQDLLRDELGFDGLVLTDDMDMKAISGRQPVEQAAVSAIAAGCDGVLICGGNHDTQAKALEAVVRAVETEELPLKRVEDALARQRRTKERFLVDLPLRPLHGQALRDRIGRAEHVAVAREMARFV